MNSDRREFIKTVILGAVSTGPVFSLLSCDNDKKPAEAEKGTQKQQENNFSEGIELRKGYMVLEPEVQKTFVALAAAVLPGTKEISNLLDLFMEKMSQDHGEAGFFDAGLWNVNTVSNMQTGKPFHQIEKKEDRESVIKLVRQPTDSFLTGSEMKLSGCIIPILFPGKNCLTTDHPSQTALWITMRLRNIHNYQLFILVQC